MDNLQLTPEETIVLYRYLRYQFLHYENTDLMRIVRKIGNHLENGELSMAEFNLVIDDDDVTPEDVMNILTGKEPGEFSKEDITIEHVAVDVEMEPSDEDVMASREPDDE